jgi:hypothetical protein
LHENIKKETPNTDFKDDFIAPQFKSHYGPLDFKRKRIFKKLLKILDYPSLSEDDKIERILNLKSKETNDASDKNQSLNMNNDHSMNEDQLDMKSKTQSFDARFRFKFDLDRSRKEKAIGAKHKWKLNEIREKFKSKIFNKSKVSLVFPKENSKFLDYYNNTLKESFNLGKNIWLLKVTSYNRGFGIELFSDLKTFFSHLFNIWMGYEEKVEEQSEVQQSNHSTDNILKDLDNPDDISINLYDPKRPKVISKDYTPYKTTDFHNTRSNTNKSFIKKSGSLSSIINIFCFPFVTPKILFFF